MLAGNMASKSAVMQDFSPLQIGTTGFYQQRKFTIRGRLQIDYGSGFWNEWFCVFDDNSIGWLSESNDGFVFVEEAIAQEVPVFAALEVGRAMISYQKIPFVLSDKREINLGDLRFSGELPYKIEANSWRCLTDWRYGINFLTIDYGTSRNDKVQFFFGKSVKLEELQLANTRSEYEIRSTAGKIRSEYNSGNCPHCGGMVSWTTNSSNTIYCEYCQSTLTLQDYKLNLKKTNTKPAEFYHSLSLGMQANYGGNLYTVIGIVCKKEYENLKGALAEGVWIEYLLYSPNAGFLWLTETNEAWTIAETMHNFPKCNLWGNKIVCPEGYSPSYEYVGKVYYALGAFYWEISKDDKTTYYDFTKGRDKICAELTDHELVFSRQLPSSVAEIAELFGLSKKTLLEKKRIHKFESPSETEDENSTMDSIVSVVFWLIVVFFVFLEIMSSDGDRSYSGGGSSFRSGSSYHK